MTSSDSETKLSQEMKTAFMVRVHEELKKSGQIPDLVAFDAAFRENQKELTAPLQSMLSKDYVKTQTTQLAVYELAAEGQAILDGKESDEKIVLQFIGTGKPKKEAIDRFKGPLMGILNGLVKSGCIILETPEGQEPTYKPGAPFEDKNLALLQQFVAEAKARGNDLGAPKHFDPLLKKRWISKQTKKVISVAKGDSFDAFTTVEQVSLTNDMLRTDQWATMELKEKKFTVANDFIPWGKLHPLVEMRAQFRKIFLKLGFSEMYTRRYVESSFWNFDALYQPQAHPCRDQQDTFFVASADRVYSAEPTPAASTPAQPTPSPCVSDIPQDFEPFDLSENIPPAMKERIQATHEEGGEIAGGSRGLRYVWNEYEGMKNIMRTHTTAISARTLATLTDELKRHWANDKHVDLKKEEKKDEKKEEKCTESAGKGKSEHLAKFFSIDRVFRNETLDKTHLAEFHQLEGFVVGEGLNMKDLMATIAEFFNEIGMKQLKFQPTYNPYTEPSLEMYAFHPLLKKWIEIGNSGIFREEVMQPLGLRPGVRAIAWGLSLERPAMIQADVASIESLFGPKVDVEWVEKSQLKMLHP